MSTPVTVGNFEIGGPDFVVIAGPCSIESRPQFSEVAQYVRELGAAGLRGGMFKLRTSPDSFQGLGHEAYQLALEIKKQVQLPFISEVTDPREIELMAEVVDMFQVGSRNMHNYSLLKELGGIKKPVLLKRGFAGTVKEWLLSAEYIQKYGNPNVVLCERGIRTFETSTRNTLDLNSVAYIKATTRLPVLVDPSHGTGMTELVTPMALAGAAAGADGIIVEVHPRPSEALSDGYQALNFAQFKELMRKLERLLIALERPIYKPKTSRELDGAWPEPTLNA